MRVWVTGAAGFVGRHLVPSLERAGREVIATDRELDVTDAAAVRARAEEIRPAAVVHLAAQSSVAASWRDPASTYRVNFVGTRFLLEALVQCGGRTRVLLVGSADAYGTLEPGAAPFTERSPLRPRSPYARSKCAADLLGARYPQLDVVRVRAFNHAGPGQSEAFVLSSFARQIAEIERGGREAVLRVGNLDSVRDFLDVGDVIEAYRLLLEPRVPAGVYNVAIGRGRRIGELLDVLLERARVRPRIEVDPERLRPRDVSVGDAGRLRAATGWRPRVPLEASLEALLESWRHPLSAA